MSDDDNPSGAPHLFPPREHGSPGVAETEYPIPATASKSGSGSVLEDGAACRDANTSNRHGAPWPFPSQGWTGNASEAVSSAFHVPGQFPAAPWFPPYYPHFPGMYYGQGMQPMSGMAGVGFAPFSQGQPPNPHGSYAVPGTGGFAQQGERSARASHRAASLSGSVSPRRRQRGRSPVSYRGSRSPSPRRAFVQKARKHRSPSHSSSHSSGSEEEGHGETEELEEEKSFDFSIQSNLAILGQLRPDLVSPASRDRARALSAGERALSKRQAKDLLVLKQSELVADTLKNLQLEIRAENDPPAPDQPADLPHGALKTGDLLRPPKGFIRRKNATAFLAKGVLPSDKLTPSSSDLSCRSNRQEFKPVLKEKGLAHLEESALRGLESLSVTDTVLGVVADFLDDSSGEDSRKPSNHELRQLLHFACRSVTHAVDATARCYLSTILVRRDSFLGSADKLPDTYNRAALRCLPISAPALFGPQVALNVEKWDKREFDFSVRKIVSKAGGRKSSPRKRFSNPESLPPAKFRKGDVSSSRSSSFSKRNTGRGNHHSSRGKSKPKGSAHPQ